METGYNDPFDMERMMGTISGWVGAEQTEGIDPSQLSTEDLLKIGGAFGIVDEEGNLIEEEEDLPKYLISQETMMEALDIYNASVADNLVAVQDTQAMIAQLLENPNIIVNIEGSLIETTDFDDAVDQALENQRRRRGTTGLHITANAGSDGAPGNSTNISAANFIE